MIESAIDVMAVNNKVPHHRNLTSMKYTVQWQWTRPAQTAACPDIGHIDVGKEYGKVYARPKCLGLYNITLMVEDTNFPGSAFGEAAFFQDMFLIWWSSEPSQKCCACLEVRWCH